MVKVVHSFISRPVTSIEEVPAITVTMDAETVVALHVLMGGFIFGRDTGLRKKLSDLYDKINASCPNLHNAMCYSDKFVDRSEKVCGAYFVDAIPPNCEDYIK